MRRSPSIGRPWSARWAVSALAALVIAGCRATLEEGSKHRPWVRHACNSCHDTEGSLSFGVYPASFVLPTPRAGSAQEPTIEDRTRARLRVRVDQLCFQCHKDLDPQSPGMRGLWLHPPFRAGVCLGCHDPHQSGHPRLLVEYPWAPLCSRCHPDYHKGRGSAAHPGRCDGCHSPHAQRGPTEK